MNHIKKILILMVSLAGLNLAEPIDLQFSEAFTPCLIKDHIFSSSNCYDKNGKKEVIQSPRVRLRVIDPPFLATSRFGFYLEKPFFIIDGIHLSTDEVRTLSQLQEETEEFGIPEMLKSLGYTPVLVQFTHTVTRSLQKNSDVLASLLEFLNDNKVIPFPNKLQDGYVILGISQGGIIGGTMTIHPSGSSLPWTLPTRVR